MFGNEQEKRLIHLEWAAMASMTEQRKQRAECRETSQERDFAVRKKHHYKKGGDLKQPVKNCWVIQTEPCITLQHLQSTISLIIVLYTRAENAILLSNPTMETPCDLPSHSDRYNYRVELGKHSLQTSEEGSIAREAATIIRHEDYNILLSR